MKSPVKKRAAPKKKTAPVPPSPEPRACYGHADPTMSARLEGPPPVRLFWLVLGPERDAFRACIAYCEACKKSDRSWFDFSPATGNRRTPEGQDERKALSRLKERHQCPHTETAEILLAMQQLEDPTR